MATAIFVLCALTCAACCGLLVRANFARPHRVLFWSALCFAGLTLNNLLLLVDNFVVPGMDLSTLRLAIAQVSLLLLVFGLLGEGRS
jgi:hypothetical protein